MSDFIGSPTSCDFQATGTLSRTIGRTWGHMFSQESTVETDPLICVEAVSANGSDARSCELGNV